MALAIRHADLLMITIPNAMIDLFQCSTKVLLKISVQFSTSSAVWPTGSWIHRGFHSCAPIFIFNGVIPDNISTYCPLRDSDDIFK